MECPEVIYQCSYPYCSCHLPEPPAAPTLKIARTPFNDMARDAARYRWLRNPHNELLPQLTMILGGFELDAAIDKAMLNAIQPCKSAPET